MRKNFSKYLNITELERAMGFYVLTAGHSTSDIRQTYPDNRSHPEDHSFTWNKGRMLNGIITWFFIRRGRGISIRSSPGPGISASTCFTCFFPAYGIVINQYHSGLGKVLGRF